MKIALSNLGWSAENNERVYAMMDGLGIRGLEIAPTKLFGAAPYDSPAAAENYRGRLGGRHRISVVSMQSLWYGRSERIFGLPEERELLLGYTKKAVDFAERLGCRVLVFGCPKNRAVGGEKYPPEAVTFFKDIGDYAATKNAVIALEPNPTAYGTDFLNTTRQALDFCAVCGTAGLAVNLDFGTVIANGELLDLDSRDILRIRHLHISEPGLRPIERRAEHGALREMLEKFGYDGYISAEMGEMSDLGELRRAAEYMKAVFG